MKLFLVAISIALSSALSAQYDTLSGKFLNYNFESGLSSSGITCFLESEEGYMWIGTEEGLNRFDGIVFKNYLKTDSTNTLPDNYINDLVELKDGRIVVGTSKGLAFYNPRSDDFERLPLPVYEDSISLENSYALEMLNDTSILVGFRNSIGYRGGLVNMNTSSGEYRIIAGETIDHVNDVKIDQKTSEVWVSSKQLTRLDYPEFEKVETFECTYCTYNHQRTHSRIVLDDSALYVGTWGSGVMVFDRKSKEYIDNFRYEFVRKGQAVNAIASINPKDESTLYVSTADKGFGELNKETGIFSFYQHDPEDKNSIYRISSRTSCIDARGIVWAGMASGLSILNPYNFQIQNIHLEPWESIHDERLFTFMQSAETDRHYVVSANNSKGYLKVDKRTNQPVSVIGETLDGFSKVWGLTGVEIVNGANGLVYTMSLGRLFSIDPQSDKVVRVVDLYKNDGLKGQSGSVNTLHRDGDFLWFGTDDNLIGKFDMRTGEYDTWWLEGEGPTGKANLIYELAPDQEKVWIAARYGVYEFHNGEVSFVNALSEEKKRGRLSLESVVAHNGKVYLGDQREGLLVMDSESYEIVRYGREEGIPGLRISEMTIDQSGVIWGLTNNGMFSFTPIKKNPVAVFSTRDGLTRNDLLNYEISTLASGKITIGRDYGLDIFQPSELKSQPAPDQLAITELQVDGVALPAYQMHRTLVEHGAALNLTFRALDFIKPEKYKYFYRLDENSPWLELDEPRLAFTKLEEDLQLFLIASSESGEFMENSYDLLIDVDTPFWLKRWFYGLLVLIFLFAVYIAYRWRLKRIKEKEALNTEYNRRIAEVELSALRAQMNPHFLFNCLNSIKFFIINKETDQASDYLTKFGRLIRLILSNSKSEFIPLATELEALNLYVDLEGLRFDDRFEFQMELDPEVQTEFIEVPPMVIQPFVENSIWHGLMHKDGPGKLSVEVTMDDEDLICTVEDNGVGRKRAAEMKSKSANKEKSMGMSITRDRLLKMAEKGFNQERIEIVDLIDEQGEPSGTRVIIRIPLQ